ncbi:hypothetical protein [Terrabacter sp. BE26]|uniref:hypothetical protein n=1 Tax=Terrabacter sp. BE26 TaxID=2898152 RepID=UPI0035BE4B5C
MALRDAFSRFLRKGSGRSSGDESDSSRATALNDLANDIDAGEDPELLVLVERLEGYYDPATDEFVPTAVAVETIEAFDGDDARELVRALGDAAPASGTGQEPGQS